MSVWSPTYFDPPPYDTPVWVRLSPSASPFLALVEYVPGREDVWWSLDANTLVGSPSPSGGSWIADRSEQLNSLPWQWHPLPEIR